MNENLPPHLPAVPALDRRQFIKRAAFGSGLVAALPFAPFEGDARDFDNYFQHGVASGDPLPDAVIIWTRVTPAPEATPGSGLGAKANVHWEIATDDLFENIVAEGTVKTTAAIDHTVKADVSGLAPATRYYFRFRYKGIVSNVGRAMTAPASGAEVSRLRFGVASCANFEAGYYTAYRFMAQRDDLAFVLHLGDYIYEYASGVYGPGPAISRIHDPLHEMVSLEDYRRRHACYKRDADLQFLHAKHSFICTWDDHELTNDSWKDGAENHQPEEGDFAARKAASYRAYFEWMPIRLPNPGSEPTRIYRHFKFGNLADLNMLDLRQYRDQQPINGLDPAKDSPARTIAGEAQLAWFKQNLSQSSAAWKVVGNSVMIAPIDFSAPGVPRQILQQLGLMMGVPYNVDQWDGYRVDRKEILDHLANNNINNVVFLTGDIHSSWSCDVPRNPGAYALGQDASVAVEFVGTSITSDNLNEILGLPPRNPVSIQVETVFKFTNRHVKLLEFDSHGYSVVEITPERMQMDWFYISERTNPNATQQFATAWQVVRNTNKVIPAAGPFA